MTKAPDFDGCRYTVQFYFNSELELIYSPISISLESETNYVNFRIIFLARIELFLKLDSHRHGN